MMVLQLNDYQKDIFREIGNIGIGHGATALSQMISRDVLISIPDIKVVDVEEIFAKSGEFLVSNCNLQGDLDGGILGIFDKNNAFNLIDLMCFQPIGTNKEINDDVKSAFNEMVNIVGGCYLNALADMLQVRLLPKPPTFLYGQLPAIKESFFSMLENVNDTFFVKTSFTIGGENISGAIYLLFTSNSNKKILELIDKMH